MKKIEDNTPVCALNIHEGSPNPDDMVCVEKVGDDLYHVIWGGDDEKEMEDNRNNIELAFKDENEVRKRLLFNTLNTL